MTSYQTKTAPTNYNDALPIHFASAQPSSLGGGKSSGSLHRQLLNVQQQQQQTEVLVIPPATRGAVFDSIEPSESDKFISVEQTSLDLEQLLALPNAVRIHSSNSHISRKLLTCHRFQPERQRTTAQSCEIQSHRSRNHIYKSSALSSKSCLRAINSRQEDD